MAQSNDSQHSGEENTNDLTPVEIHNTKSSSHTQHSDNSHDLPANLTYDVNTDLAHTTTATLTASDGEPIANTTTLSLPKGERRGMLASLVIPRERFDARTHSPAMKNYIVFVIALAAMTAPMGSSIFLPAMTDVAKDLNTTSDIVNVSFGIYMLALGIFPLWWSSISEIYGRRTVYLVSFTMFVGFTIGCALSPNVAGLMVFRILSGGAAASVQAVGAGTISDIYITTERGRAMGYYYLGPLCGPLLAPILGGLITTKWGWRGTQWFLVIVGGVCLLLIAFGLPETLRSASLISRSREASQRSQLSPETNKNEKREESSKDSKRPVAEGPRTAEGAVFEKHEESQGERDPNENTGCSDDTVSQADVMMPVVSRFSSRQEPDPDVEANLERVKTTASEKALRSKEEQDPGSVLNQIWVVFIRPFKTLKFFTFPPVALSIIFSSYCFCCLYFLNIGIESLYSHSPYNFSSIIVGLLFIPNSVGYFLSSIFNGYWSDRILKRSIRKNGVEVPEARIAENVYLSSVLYPASLLIFGWTANYKVFWLCPLIGTFIYGVASMIIFGNTMTYLVDTLPGRGSSGVALNNLVRMCLAAIATFVAGPLERAMGFGWLYTMLAIGAILVTSCIVAIKKWGSHWRNNFDMEKIFS
uniref:ARAD1C33044p n=1 Tax=Blastobotrys adeninivorans TaxID=409370 RepID=A0A060T3G1_BLAAD